CSAASSWQSGQTSRKSSPSGAKRVVRSPTRRVRSQIAHVRAATVRVGRMEGDYSPRVKVGQLATLQLCVFYTVRRLQVDDRPDAPSARGPLPSAAGPGPVAGTGAAGALHRARGA